jgi:hypothetical protein
VCDKNIFHVEDSLVLRAITFTLFNRIERFKSLFKHPNYTSQGCIKYFDFCILRLDLAFKNYLKILKM